MANFVCALEGARGRSIRIYDNKCEIRTGVTVGSLVTGNATDGYKTIFYIDCTGVQFKPSGLAIGYLQLETSSMQVNNQNSNFFSENTFTFEAGAYKITNALMQEVYNYICTRIEGYKYNDTNLLNQPVPDVLSEASLSQVRVNTYYGDEAMIFFCPRCHETYGVETGRVPNCPECKKNMIQTTFTRSKWRSLSNLEKQKLRNEMSQGLHF